ncbi:MAG: Gfo/Idh/MocA family protein, partial [Methyloligellaceae bacterium]
DSSQTSHKVGVIGLGAIGRVVLANMVQHPRFEVVDAWDPDAVACDAVRGAFPDVDIAGGAEALVANPDTTVVYIATPPKTHAPYVRAAAEAGKGVYCEKPLGVDVSEARELVAFVEGSGVPTAINFNHGNASASTFVEAQLASGEMGEIASVDIFIHLTQWPRDFQKHAKWLEGREQGGFTREMLSHWFYLTRRLLGDGEIVRAAVRYPQDPDLAETRVVAELTFGGVPTVVNAACGGAGPVGTEYTLWGRQKSYRMRSGGRLDSSDGRPWQPELEDIDDLSATDHRRNLDAAAHRFDGAPVKLSDIKDGFAVQELVEALLAT